MTTRTGYSLIQIALHWLILVLIAGAWLLGDQMHGYEKLPATAALPLHGILGLSVFFLMILRLLLRLWLGAPPPPASDPKWQRRAATLTHWAIYALAILGPWAGGFAFYLRLDIAADLHEVLINLLIIAILAHTAAALYHQFVLKDNLLARMRPGGSRV
ncbi:hypothetical protein ATO6_07435 [Oceanicola sp. 22II-s10i]|uniref:cytochrome b n=1 Tax=Oceanicola sp. 22II-s10i TaxID=1317116 RepID=UPI000B521A45|nr:cytochrome b/b6 domain-containing protein [Oceanicola sp. 22II-s10i]OWU86606.1 hypothetical protein ATO6_07435 [Oceanicola sp. 22II-s10i]